MKIFKNLRNTFYLLLFIFIPLLLWNILTDNSFYSEIICGDEICTFDPEKSYYAYCSEDDYILGSDAFHYSTRHWILQVFQVIMFIVYTISMVLYYIKMTFPRTYKEMVNS